MGTLYRAHSSRLSRIARVRWGAMLVFAAAVLGFGPVGQAAADDCVALGGAELGGECVIGNAVPAKTGTFTLDKTLRFTAGGSLKVGAAGITINITLGNFVMLNGTLIDANNSPNGAPITVTLANGNIDLQTGSTIRSNGIAGGFIQLTTASTGIANVDGTVESVGTQSGTGGNQGPGGGPITIKAGCELTISDTGVVSSRGFDAGADLVHLEGCVVDVFGRVESTASGHGIPNNPANSCSDAATSSPRRNPITRPGKPKNSTGCVEIWSGTTVTIDSTGTHRGEVNADIGTVGGTQGRGWIDILANGNITIADDTGNDRSLTGIGCTVQTTFAVHANGGLCQNTDDGGLILIQSYGGDVIASGDAIQADGSQTSPNLSGGIGGEIRVEAQSDILFTNANVFARGDFVAAGGFGIGGKIGPLVPTVPPPGAAPLRAFNGQLSWVSGIGDARPTGQPVPVAQRGQINLQACTSVTLGASFPVNAPAVLPYPNVLGNACGGAPTMPAYVVGFPSALCDTICRSPGGGRKLGQKFHDLLANGMKDPGDPGLPNWEMRVYRDGFFVISQVTDANGNYEFTLLPGTYVVCEVLQPGWAQTFPSAIGGNVVDCLGLEPGVNLAAFGYRFTITDGSVETGNDFGNALAAPLCPQDLNAIVTIAVDASGTSHGVPGFTTVGAAYAAAVDGDVIGIFSNTTENVVLNGSKSVTITQCTNAAVTAANPGQPVWTISSTGTLVIIGPDAIGGTIGWSIESDNHDIRGVRASGASDAGIVIGPNATGNEVSFNSVSGSGVGVRIEGDNNDVRGSGVTGSAGIGVFLTTTANANQFANSKVDNNGGHGIVVAGTNNVIKNNQAGSSNGKGNAGDGIRVSGTGNTLDSNKTSANGANGINVLAGASNTRLKGDQSNTGTAGSNKENALCEYRFGDPGTLDQGGNKKDNVNFVGTGSPKTYAAGCFE